MTEFYQPSLAEYLLETVSSRELSFKSARSTKRAPSRDTASAGPASSSFLERAEAWEKKRELRRNELVQKSSRSERQECIFVPTITAKARRLHSRGMATPDNHAARRLSADAARRQLKLEGMQAEADERRALKELEECTFRPHINSHADVSPFQFRRVERFVPDRPKLSPPPMPRSVDRPVARAPVVVSAEPAQTVESARSLFLERLVTYERRRALNVEKNRAEASRNLTLKPQISDHSRRLAADALPFEARVALAERQKAEHLKSLREKQQQRGLSGVQSPMRRPQSSPSSSPQRRTPPNKHQVEFIRETVEATLVKELTFQPKINRSPTAKSRVKELTAIDDYGKQLWAVQQERERMAAEIMARRAEEELEECTFQPNARKKASRVRP